jgi:hypothetical protein
MKDLLLTESGDLSINDSADVTVTDSVIQAIQIRLRWFLGEWKINTDYGIPYYDDIFVKNPSLPIIEDLIRSEILKVDEVDSVEDITITIDSQKRSAKITFTVVVDGDSEEGEVLLNG